MNSPLVSIITPTYNHERYIADCIGSAQAQTYTNWEMIVVDDGSTDNTLQIAKSFAENDARIKVFTQQNVGIFRLGETYNFALKHSAGKYVAVLEGDDVWLAEKLALQVLTLEADEHSILCYGQAFSSSADLNSNFGLTDFSNLTPEILNNNPIGAVAKVMLFSNFIVALTVLIRRSALDEIGGFKQSHRLPLIDFSTWIELSLCGTFSCIQKPLGKWRIYPNQITKTYTAEIYEGFYRFALDFYTINKDFYNETEITKRQIDKYFHKQLVEAHSRSGRYKLIRKDFVGARRNYLKSIYCFGFHNLIWKLRSAIGFVFSLFHADIEQFAKRMGRVSYK